MEVSDATFQAEVEQHKGSPSRFLATWCGPCHMVAADHGSAGR